MKAKYTDLICTLCQVSPEQHFVLVEQLGEAFVKQQCGADVFGIQELLNSRDIFWSWWLNQWGIRNEVFVNRWSLDRVESTDPMFAALLMEEYEDFHQKAMNATVMNRSYAVMVGRFIREVTRKEVKA